MGYEKIIGVSLANKNRGVRIQDLSAFLLPNRRLGVDVGVGFRSGVDAGAGDGYGVPEVWPPCAAA